MNILVSILGWSFLHSTAQSITIIIVIFFGTPVICGIDIICPRRMSMGQCDRRSVLTQTRTVMRWRCVNKGLNSSKKSTFLEINVDAYLAFNFRFDDYPVSPNFKIKGTFILYLSKTYLTWAKKLQIWSALKDKNRISSMWLDRFLIIALQCCLKNSADHLLSKLKMRNLFPLRRNRW